MKVESKAGVTGSVYTETVVWAAPEAYVADAPYQLAIVDLDGGERLTCCILGPHITIDDHVEFVEQRESVSYFRKSSAS